MTSDTWRGDFWDCRHHHIQCIGGAVRCVHCGAAISYEIIDAMRDGLDAATTFARLVRFQAWLDHRLPV